MAQSIDKDLLKEKFLTMVENSKEPTYPDCLNDERLEDAFKTPVIDGNGCCESIPTIWNDYEYGKYDDGVLFITAKSTTVKSNLYSKYLEEEAFVWDSVNKRLLLYIPDSEEPRMAFKGSSWQFAKRLKPEYEDFINLRDVYYELMNIE